MIRDRTPNPTFVEAVRGYLFHGWIPGSFTTAVLVNDLKQAIAHADDENLQMLFGNVSYLYNIVPGAAWGSREKVAAWMRLSDVERAERLSCCPTFREDIAGTAWEDKLLSLNEEPGSKGNGHGPNGHGEVKP